MEVKVKENIKSARLLEVDIKPEIPCLGFATSNAHFVSLRDLKKDETFQAQRSKVDIWQVEVERAVKKGDKVMIATKGMIKALTKEGQAIGVALEDGKKGDVISIKKIPQRA